MELSFENNKKIVDRNKLRGGYYTPQKLASYLVRWSFRTGRERILESSVGDGNFVEAILIHAKQEKYSPFILGIEIEEEELQKAKLRAAAVKKSTATLQWICGDFFIEYEKLKQQESFDIFIGNPPFIRFQRFEEKSREVAFKHLKDAQYQPTKLANAWSAFVQLGIELLRPGGRMALVVPAEIMQVIYAKELRSRLSKVFDHIVLIGFRKLVFPEIEQEVVLLLAEGKRETVGESCDIHTIEFDDGDHLIDQDDLTQTISHVPSKHTRNGMKWTALFLSDHLYKSLDEAEQSAGLTPLGNLAQVDIGVVTGNNAFFVLSNKTRDEIGANNYISRIVGKTSSLTSIVFGNNDFEEFSNKYCSQLLNLNGISEEKIPDGIQRYLLSGIEQEVHKGYKTSIRKRWFDVPSVYIPDAFLFRQIHRFPILVVNEAKTTSTDTIHRVRINQGIDPHLLAATFFNSLTFAWAEVCGRSYGGGVLELEPSEAEEIPVPYNSKISIDFEKIDELLRRGRSIETLDYVDSIVLKDNLGLDQHMIRDIRIAWAELRDRRINRKHNKLSRVNLKSITSP